MTAVHLALATGRVGGRVLLGPPRAVERFPVRRDLAYDGLEVILGDGRRVSACSSPTRP